MKKLIVSFCGLLVAGASVHAQVIAQWTFEASIPTPNNPGAGNPSVSYAPEVGSGAAFGLHAGPAVYTGPAGNGSTHSLSSTNWSVGDYYQFSTSTLGYSGIKVSYDQASSNTGPGKGKLQYSIDGSTFADASSEYSILANAAPNPGWNINTSSSLFSFSYDLSSITALDNAANVYFRIVDTQTISANGGTVATGGSERVDNFTIATVPEPACFALAGLGILAFGLLRKRN